MKVCVLHIGMHKTGSSSIQQTLSRIERHNMQYLDLGSPNHSAFLATIFNKNPEKYHGHIKAGRSAEEVYALRGDYVEKLKHKAMMAEKEYVVISGEDLSHPFGEDRVTAIKEFLDPYFDSFKVIGYVRSPVSFMQSALQQQVKGGARALQIRNLYPRYQDRFEPFDKVFGRENVELVPFDKSCLVGGDVVQDFAGRISVTLSENEIVRSNESLSAGATAILFAYHKFGPGYGSFKGAVRENNLLIGALREIGGGKLEFHSDLAEPMLEEHDADICWMENRLGYSLRENNSESDNTIKSESDILAMAGSAATSLSEVIRRSLGNNPSAESVAGAVAFLRDSMSGRHFDKKNRISSSSLERRIKDALSDSGISPIVIFREIGLAFEESGDLESAKQVVDMGLKLRPSARGLLMVSERLTTKLRERKDK